MLKCPQKVQAVAAVVREVSRRLQVRHPVAVFVLGTVFDSSQGLVFAVPRSIHQLHPIVCSTRES